MEQYLAEIRMFAGNFPPRGWAFCNGQILSIAQNTALFALLGTTYGGNGQTTFALPNLQSRIPIGTGQGPGLTNYELGNTTGAETVTLNNTEIPAHTHVTLPGAVTGSLAVATHSDSNSPAGQVFGPDSGSDAYTTGSANETMGPDALSNVNGNLAMYPAGGSIPHNNLQPYLTLSYIICINGEFPQRY